MAFTALFEVLLTAALCLLIREDASPDAPFRNGHIRGHRHRQGQYGNTGCRLDVGGPWQQSGDTRYSQIPTPPHGSINCLNMPVSRVQVCYPVVLEFGPGQRQERHGHFLRALFPPPCRDPDFLDHRVFLLPGRLVRCSTSSQQYQAHRGTIAAPIATVNISESPGCAIQIAVDRTGFGHVGFLRPGNPVNRTIAAHPAGLTVQRDLRPVRMPLICKGPPGMLPLSEQGSAGSKPTVSNGVGARRRRSP